MLKITTHIDIDSNMTVFALEGRLIGPWVTELEQCWRTVPIGQSKPRLRVDLSGVTYIDAEGKALLAHMHHSGAELIAAGCLTKCIVEEIMRAGPFDLSNEECGKESAHHERGSRTEERTK